MFLVWVVLFILLILVVLSIVASIGKSQNRSMTGQALREFSPGSEAAVSEHGLDGIAFNASSRTIMLVKHGAPRTIDYADVLSAQLLRDGTVVQRTNRGSQIAGAAIGAALLGPVGLLAGAVTGSKSLNEKISSLTLRILLRSGQPYADVVFYRGPPTDVQKLAGVAAQAQNALSTLQSISAGSARDAW
jgi:hypothetical protein